jgi:cell division protein FtsA
LALPYSEAAQIKDQWGVALSAWVDPQETIEHPAPGGGTRRVPRELLAHIIEQRIDEIFGLVRDQMLRSQFGDRLGSGVVLTGGGALLPGITELAERSLGLPVRVGTPERGLEGLADSLRRPKFATAAGLVLYAARLRSGGERERDRLEPPLRSARHVLRRVRDWLADFF